MSLVASESRTGPPHHLDPTAPERDPSAPPPAAPDRPVVRRVDETMRRTVLALPGWAALREAASAATPNVASLAAALCAISDSARAIYPTGPARPQRGRIRVSPATSHAIRRRQKAFLALQRGHITPAEYASTRREAAAAIRFDGRRRWVAFVDQGAAAAEVNDPRTAWH
ncbi:hypothetical protein CXG81DRAFT_28815 [Caulochytrium protostelioides]|uniref:Uncharacterized protein n=1 Tax=Caulochytrium protostelioides TaxID=1555241 RepID=A0A4P9X0S1_9FUNG|nr:hypothetical protein CXG81DRAFT_28815 [Caulochytrium protostelioides]|eukprot:RKO98343.1 hypothetical protein CXG81DRAFT_28815 [Caulochytrium protostelioides]